MFDFLEDIVDGIEDVFDWGRDRVDSVIDLFDISGPETTVLEDLDNLDDETH